MVRKGPPDPGAAVMSFGDHIEELRRRLIFALLGVVLALGVTLYYGRTIIAFLMVPLQEVQRLADLPIQTYTRSNISAFSIYLKVSIISALIVSGPWVIFQMWKFIEAGLYEVERKTASILMVLSMAMTGLGLVFMYYELLPATLAFFIFWTTTYPAPSSQGSDYFRWVTKKFMWANDKTMGIGPAAAGTQVSTGPASTEPVILPQLENDPVSPIEGQVWCNTRMNEVRFFHNGRVGVFTTTGGSMIVPLIDPNEYVGELIVMALVIVIVFHVPVVMGVLGLTGLVKPETLSKRRRIIIFGCFVAAIFLTPSQDVFSNVALPVLTWGLFELGLVVMRFFYRKHHGGDGDQLAANG